MRRAFAATCWPWCASSARRWCAIPAATSSPATAGKTASGRVEASPAPARSGVAVDRDQRVRHQRVHRLVPRRRRGADAGRQPRHPPRRRRAPAAGILQPPGRHRAAPTCARAHGWPAAARHPALVPRQRDGRPVADGDQERRRVRPHCRRSGQDDEALRSDPRAGGVRLVGPQHADASAPGKRRCSRTPSSTSTSSRCTPTSTTTPATLPAMLASPDLMDALHRRSRRDRRCGRGACAFEPSASC